MIGTPVLDPSGIIRRIKYKFALLPRRTDDIGLTLFQSYQVLDIERKSGRERRVLGDPINWYTRSWGTPTALRNDGTQYMRYEPR